MKKYIPSEFEDCVTFRQYLDLRNLLYTHLAQETYTTSWNQKRKNKEMGVHKGFPDYAIVVKDRLVFIEMKREKGGKVSPEQKEWIKELSNCKGVSAYVCKGAQEAMDTIEYFIK